MVRLDGPRTQNPGTHLPTLPRSQYNIGYVGDVASSADAGSTALACTRKLVPVNPRSPPHGKWFVSNASTLKTESREAAMLLYCRTAAVCLNLVLSNLTFA